MELTLLFHKEQRQQTQNHWADDAEKHHKMKILPFW